MNTCSTALIVDVNLNTDTNIEDSRSYRPPISPRGGLIVSTSLKKGDLFGCGVLFQPPSRTRRGLIGNVTLRVVCF